MPQRNYSYPSAVARLGQPGSARAAQYARTLKLLNPVLFEERTETVGGTEADGDYTITVSSAKLGLAPTDVTVTRATTPATNADLATALAAAGSALESLQSLFTFTNPSSGVVNIKCKVPSAAFTLGESAPGGASITEAVVVNTTSEQRIPLGRGCVESATAGEVALPTTSSNLGDFKGITRYNEAGIAANEGDATVDGYDPGSVLSLQQDEEIWADGVEAMSAGAHPHWLLSSGNEGKFGATLDGTAQVITITPTAEDAIAVVMEIYLSNGQTFGLPFTTQGSSTATTISTQIRAAIAANEQLSKHILGTGTATAILTSLSGLTFDVNFIEAGATLAFAKVYTTPAVVQSHMLTDWEVAASTTGAGPVKLRKVS